MKLYYVNVSSLQVRKDVKKNSNVTLTRNTVIKAVENSPQKQYNHQRWIEIETVNKPVVRGYVQLKYLTFI